MKPVENSAWWSTQRKQNNDCWIDQRDKNMY